MARAFLKFNISSVPDGAIGITAVLELYTGVNGVPVQHFVDVYSHNDTAWDEELRLPSSNWAGTKKLDTEWVASNERWYEWNVTNAIVEAISNSTSVVTFIVMYPYGEDKLPVSFTSKDDTLTKMPKLTITWTSVIPEFPFFMMPLVMVATTAVSFIIRKRCR